MRLLLLALIMVFAGCSSGGDSAQPETQVVDATPVVPPTVTPIDPGPSSPQVVWRETQAIPTADIGEIALVTVTQYDNGDCYAEVYNQKNYPVMLQVWIYVYRASDRTVISPDPTSTPTFSLALLQYAPRQTRYFGKIGSIGDEDIWTISCNSRQHWPVPTGDG